MNELINSPVIVTALEKVGVATEAGLQEAVKYNVMLGVAETLLGCAIVIALLCWSGWCVYKSRKDDDGDKGFYTFTSFIAVLLALFLSPLIIDGLCRWLNPVGYMVMRLL